MSILSDHHLLHQNLQKKKDLSLNYTHLKECFFRAHFLFADYSNGYYEYKFLSINAIDSVSVHDIYLIKRQLNNNFGKDFQF